MLDIGKTNLFLYENIHVISRIIDYYDLMGHNCLFLKFYNSKLDFKCSKIEYSDSSIIDILTKNLFRVDIIIVEITHNHHKILENIRSVTELPVIFVSNFGTYFHHDFKTCFDNVYRLYKEDTDPMSTVAKLLNIKNYEQKFLELSRINDIKNDWDMSLGDLRTQYIRDKKINDLLK